MYAHLCYKVVHYGIWYWCNIGFVEQVCCLWPLSYVVAAELRVNKSHLWQYLVVGLGEDFYLTDTEMETLRGNFQAIYDNLPQSNGSDLLPQFLSRVLFDLSETMYINHGDACSWDFADRKSTCKDDWFITTKTLFGDCFTFNYDGRFKQVGRGPEHGLRLIMNVHNDVNSGRSFSIPMRNIHIDISRSHICMTVHWLFLFNFGTLSQYCALHILRVGIV